MKVLTLPRPYREEEERVDLVGAGREKGESLSMPFSPARSWAEEWAGIRGECKMRVLTLPRPYREEEERVDLVGAGREKG